MTTFTAGYNTKVYVAQYDLSAYFNAADAERSFAELDNTTFGQTAKGRQPGLADGQAKVSGFFSADVNAVRAAFEAALGSAAGEPVTLGMIGDSAVGNPAYVWLNRETKYSTKSTVSGLVTTDAEFKPARDGLAYGFYVHPNGTENAGGNTATGIDGAAATTTGWRAALHVFSVGGTGSPTLNCKLQDSADNVTFADLTGGAFTAATAVGGQYLSGAAGATVRRYVRTLWTITGSTPVIGFVVSFARL